MKKLAFAGILLISLSLTGCVREYQLTDNETGIAAEYMAGVLLAQDGKYNSNLIAMDQLELHNNESTSDEKETEETSKETSVDDEALSQSDEEGEVEVINQKSSLSEVMGAKNFEIQFLGSEIYEAYPNDESSAYFSLTAREGNQLLVASFSVENKTKKEKRLNLKKAGINYQLDINVGTIYKPALTLLENDLRYIDITIDAGKKETVLLIFEISKDAAMKDVNLIISKDSKSEIIEIK